jgi:N-methylhydantoinase A
VRVRHELRYAGQSFELAVDEQLEPGAPSENGLDPDGLSAAFAHAHEMRYGYSEAGTGVQLVTMRASVWGQAPELRLRAPCNRAPTVEQRPIVFDGEPLSSTILRGELAPGTRLRGPALCALPESTLLVPPEWAGTVDEHGTIHLTDDA